jgi:MFS family permease
VPRLLLITPLPFALGFWMVGLVPGLGGMSIALGALALGHGLMGSVPVSFWAVFFGTRHLGSIKSLASALGVLGSAIGPGITGYLIDIGYDLPQQMIWIAGFFLGTALCLVIGMARYCERRR